MNFLVAKKVSQPLPQDMLNRQALEIPAGIHLADPTFHLPGEIDGIIGGEYFWDLMSVGRIALANPNAKLQKTLLGWIVVGKYLENQPVRPVNCHLTFEALHAEITKFWNLEEGPSGKICSPEEQACEEHYASHTSRDAMTGRYTVSLPFNDNKDKLGETYHVAMKRFFSLERSLNRNLDRKSQYVAFLREYEQLNHMTEIVGDVNVGCYLPHHPVIKADSVTTKIRVVFDASAHSSSGIALNNTLMVGPTIQQDLVGLVTRFRVHKYVLTADIAKMYRQVDLNVADRKYHKILWRETITSPIKTYQLNTVTYGTASAPFLAIRTLHQLAHDESKTHPIAAKVLLNDFYVDDVLTGAQSFDEAVFLRDDLISITAKGGFQLRQWLSNEPRLVESLGNTDHNDHMVLDATDGKKTLGLFWKARQDSLGYVIKHVKPLQRVTKRTILSRIAQLFDPLGLVGPVIVQAKLIMQALWKCHLDWDESVPVDIHGAWITFESQLDSLEELVIPRRVIADNHKVLQLHGFCDASERAYGACVYIRTTDGEFNSSVRLVSSRSRVAPLKVQSLPRLELCAAVLLVKLYNTIAKALNLSFDKVMFWSDSTITLHWIHAAPHTLKQFVANRVSKIQQHTRPDQWSHVPSQDNAADILSRGASVPDFLASDIWFNGPQWLSQVEDTWPQADLQPIDIPEKRKVVVLSAATQSEIQFLKKYSSFTMVTRVVAYCLRFCNNAHTKVKQIGPLTTDELQQARVRIIKLLQGSVFSKELHDLKANSAPSRVNRFRALCPFVDGNGLLRVGGRFEKSNLPYSTKHPVLLPQNHHLTGLLIREAHVAHGHIGAQGTLHAVRQRYWPVNGVVTVKSVLRKCITCQKLTPITVQYPMGQLPRDRVTFQRPFLIAGVDYCGPLFIKEKKHRNTKKIKVYVAVFVCFSTKAVHIELVGDLTSDAFLAALKRFFARRGRSTDIYSDNATNFVGANHKLQKVRKMILSNEHSDHVQKFLLDQHIRWHLIPPRSPHFGGLLEAAVKSVKHHLTRILGNTLLTFEELVTCLSEIEAILNSRPLTPLSSDPNDLAPLTPGHFLIGDSLISTPECDLTDIKTCRLSSWQHVQQLRQHFWHRWYKDYLNTLSVRKKWHGDQVPAITEGTLVIMKEDNSPPLHWPMGRIVAIHPGEDGIVRVVTVKTINGIYKRSVKKLAPLLLEES